MIENSNVYQKRQPQWNEGNNKANVEAEKPNPGLMYLPTKWVIEK